ncbi:O-antigen/teichoic acid export membrane protein [Silvibacterium bohemicum]|uniref:O-antigen/teichoic acid export membrane protein n=1 Tax=Silvibacterium bohemicum TaxID=1577686 RepID=A0A841JZ18_9BACT|nr:oligosaccharide flippase family protein [Silvibacterium bohemicum]MBB6143678.1 O-antigen/teichoic acid export membrane protein [Silvibacterium bohemicum]
MIVPAILPDPAVNGDLPLDVAVPIAVAPQRIPRHVVQQVASGTSALALGVFLERGCGFVANILAARFGGTAVFGAYSLAVSTANNISTYAAGGIGATAARFSGKYPRGTRGYSTLARALVIVSLVSAGIAASGLWLGAAPIAALLHKASLTGLLRWAAISAAGIILLECARGFFVGQRRLAALVLLSLIVGAGMVSLLPLMASMHRPSRMIVAQGAVTLTAVLICIALARPLGLMRRPEADRPLPLIPMLKEVWSFGFIQLAGVVASNLAGWWLTALVARADATLAQMSFFAIASQLRNLAGLGPSLITEGSYATMADPEGERTRTPHSVMALCTYASTAVALVLASLGIILVPWGLHLLYGSSYSGAAITAVVALSIAVVHMGNAPVAARLTIVSIRMTGAINTLWAIFVAIAGSLLLLHGGSAAEAMTIYLAAHVLSAGLVLGVLIHKDHVPAGMLQLFLLSTSTVVALAGMAVARQVYQAHTALLSSMMLLTFCLSLALLFLLGRRHHWLPTPSAVRQFFLRTGPSMLGFAGIRNGRIGHGD